MFILSLTNKSGITIIAKRIAAGSNQTKEVILMRIAGFTSNNSH